MTFAAITGWGKCMPPACAGRKATDLDLIVYGSCSNDEQVPNSASGVQVALGAVNAIRAHSHRTASEPGLMAPIFSEARFPGDHVDSAH